MPSHPRHGREPDDVIHVYCIRCHKTKSMEGLCRACKGNSILTKLGREICYKDDCGDPRVAGGKGCRLHASYRNFTDKDFYREGANPGAKRAIPGVRGFVKADDPRVSSVHSEPEDPAPLFEHGPSH